MYLTQNNNLCSEQFFIYNFAINDEMKCLIKINAICTQQTIKILPMYSYMALYWADVLAVGPTLFQLLLFVGKLPLR